jgi:hypothetical protein
MPDCPRCKYPIAGESTVCTQCGYECSADALNPSPDVKSASLKGFLWLVLIGLLIALLILVLVYVEGVNRLGR